MRDPSRSKIATSSQSQDRVAVVAQGSGRGPRRAPLRHGRNSTRDASRTEAEQSYWLLRHTWQTLRPSSLDCFCIRIGSAMGVDCGINAVLTRGCDWFPPQRQREPVSHVCFVTGRWAPCLLFHHSPGLLRFSPGAGGRKRLEADMWRVVAGIGGQPARSCGLSARRTRCRPRDTRPERERARLAARPSVSARRTRPPAPFSRNSTSGTRSGAACVRRRKPLPTSAPCSLPAGPW